MSLSRLASDRPLARAAASFHSAALLLISFPFSPPPMASLILPSTASRRTLSPTSIATPHSTHLYRQLVCCSAKNGQHSIGTPPDSASTVEFHPLCVRNNPTAGCRSTASWSHQLATSPLPFVASVNSRGSAASAAVAAAVLVTTSGLTIQRKSWPLPASPHANSSSSWPLITVTLP
ncbi:Os02g0578201 [Oryza sativa Japonica Group]|uniref:Os02g0578201 protein n=2 Tax=Oryza sativa subsp. japonica TaxID=39947 RepID=C7IYR7_ORYSJ|nr:hypothetical protein EE612_011995 [Oryza sativa]BAH91765.1 Os02g0578201 [Oryza sativa Japonica Group]BAS79398.1 Os02g0578201 [Oryza sativa Japonica Group]|eukprot:NP_001173036.1 Os02g0578201 [Oryza sativa Japonica Group]